MIERVLTSTMIEAAKASPSRLLAFVELEFENDWVRVHSGVGERIYNAQSYLGLGELGGIGTISENASDSGNRLNLSLKVLDPALLGEAMNYDPNGYDCYVHLVAFDEHRRILEGADYVVDGEMVDMKIKRGDQKKEIPSIINITVNDWMERWAQPVNAAKTTDEAQQHMHPGDRFFDLVEIIAGSPLSSLPTKSNFGGRVPRRRGTHHR